MVQINYIFYVMVSMALFLAGYWLLMRREVRHQMVRCYLLATMVLSLILPMVHLRAPAPIAPLTTAAPVSYQAIVLDRQLEAPAASNVDAVGAVKPETTQLSEKEKPDGGRMTLWAIVGCVYWIGAAVMVLLLVVRLVRLRDGLRRLPFSEHDGYRLAVVEGEAPAFSFGRSIVIGRGGFSDDEVAQLLGHELVHVRQHHTVDVLLCEVVKAALWFNPFVWLYSRELKRVHEYQADRQMASYPDGAGYLELLYHQIAGRAYSAIGNNFDYSLTPKRINMMKQTKKRFGSLSLLVALPVMALVLFANCKKVDGGTFVIDEITMIADDEAGTQLRCSEFFDLENREFTFHEDGTVDVVCTVDSSVNFTGRYTYSQQDGLAIYDAAGKPWMDIDIRTDYYNQDSIGLTFTDKDPVRGLEAMAEALAIKVFPTLEAYQTITTYNPDGTEVKKSGEIIDTIYPHISIASNSYDYMTAHGWFLDNRLLDATTWGGGSATGLMAIDKNDTLYDATWEYPTGHVVEGAHDIYDTITGVNPKRDDFQFHLQVKMKRK